MFVSFWKIKVFSGKYALNGNKWLKTIKVANSQGRSQPGRSGGALTFGGLAWCWVQAGVLASG